MSHSKMNQFFVLVNVQLMPIVLREQDLFSDMYSSAYVQCILELQASLTVSLVLQLVYPQTEEGL